MDSRLITNQKRTSLLALIHSSQEVHGLEAALAAVRTFLRPLHR